MLGLRKALSSIEEYPYLAENCLLYVPFWGENVQGAGPILSHDKYHHALTIVGTTWGVTGRTFDGSDDQMTFPRNTDLEVQEFTLGCWVYPTDAVGKNDCLITKDQSTGHDPAYYSAHFRLGGGTLHFEWNDGTINRSLDGGTVEEDKWSCVMVTFKSGAQEQFINCVSKDSDTRADTITWYASDWYIGEARNLANYNLTGIMGEAGMWNKVFNAGERTEYYNRSKWRYL